MITPEMPIAINLAQFMAYTGLAVTTGFFIGLWACGKWRANGGLK